MNSSLAALIAPSSGVAQAVSGYLVGMGDGVTTVFTAPPEITSISSLYRRDWQGNQLLYSTARTNRVIWSQSLCSWTNQGGIAITPGAASLGSLSLDLLTKGSTTIIQRVQQDFTIVGTGQKALSYYLKAGTSSKTFLRSLDVGTIKDMFFGDVVWTNGVPSLTPTTGTLDGIDSLGSGIYRIRCRTLSFNDGATCRVYAHGSSSILDHTGSTYVGGIQMGDDTTHGTYIPTTTSPVALTDYAASGNTITLAAAPVRAAEISLDGTATGLPLIQIR